MFSIASVTLLVRFTRIPDILCLESDESCWIPWKCGSRAAMRRRANTVWDKDHNKISISQELIKSSASHSRRHLDHTQQIIKQQVLRWKHGTNIQDLQHNIDKSGNLYCNIWETLITSHSSNCTDYGLDYISQCGKFLDK